MRSIIPVPAMIASMPTSIERATLCPKSIWNNVKLSRDASHATTASRVSGTDFFAELKACLGARRWGARLQVWTGKSARVDLIEWPPLRHRIKRECKYPTCRLTMRADNALPPRGVFKSSVKGGMAALTGRIDRQRLPVILRV